MSKNDIITQDNIRISKAHMYDVVALGELLIDFTTQSTDSDGYPTMAAHPGGAPANFLAAIAKFGGKAALLGKVGTDTFGKLLTDTLRKVGIETKGLVASDEFFTTLAFVTLDENGNREFAFAQARRRHAASLRRAGPFHHRRGARVPLRHAFSDRRTGKKHDVPHCEVRKSTWQAHYIRPESA